MSKSVRPGKSRSIYESGIEQACQARTCVCTYTHIGGELLDNKICCFRSPPGLGWARLHRILVLKGPFRINCLNQIKSINQSTFSSTWGYNNRTKGVLWSLRKRKLHTRCDNSLHEGGGKRYLWPDQFKRLFQLEKRGDNSGAMTFKPIPHLLQLSTSIQFLVTGRRQAVPMSQTHSTPVSTQENEETIAVLGPWLNSTCFNSPRF